MSEIELICDLFEWLPPWGEFDVRHYEKHLAFCIEVDYEVGEPQDPDKPIFTKLITFKSPVAVINSHWPLPTALILGNTGLADRGQIVDLGNTELRANCMFNFRRMQATPLPELRHYYVYFDDMKQTYQVVAESVDVTDTDPPADV